MERRSFPGGRWYVRQLGSWLCGRYGFPAGQARAQSESATPVAGQPAEPRSGLIAASWHQGRAGRRASIRGAEARRGAETRSPWRELWGISIRARFTKILKSLSATWSRSFDLTRQRCGRCHGWRNTGSGGRMAWSSSSCCAMTCSGTTGFRSRPPTPLSRLRSTEVTSIPLSAASSPLVESFDAVSERELRVRFTARDANWLFNVATLPIVSKQQYGEFWQEMPASGQTLSGFDWSGALPVGTGPWRITEWDATEVKFTRFDRYWGREPWLDQLEVTVLDGPRARLEAWQDGDCQMLWPVRVREVQKLDDATGTLYPVPAASVMFAAFNFANPNQPAGSLWTDLRVRLAASQAINRERYAAEVFGGFTRWQAAGTVAQPWAHEDDLTTPAYSPEAASVLLTEAGWIDYDGDGVREDVNGWQFRPVAIVREDSRPELAAVMARVARDLAGVGIALSVEVLPPDVFDDRWITRPGLRSHRLRLRPAPRIYRLRSLWIGVGHPK